MARRRRVLLFVTALLAVGLGALTQATDGLQGLEEATIDARFSVRSDDSVPSDVVVLGMDPDTFDEYGEPPIPRRRHAQAIDALNGAGAKTIAYDLAFRDETSVVDDNALFRAIRRAGNVVLASLIFTEKGGFDVLGGPRSQRLARTRVGYAGYDVARGDVFRDIPESVEGAPTFAGIVSGHPRAAIIDYRGMTVIPFLDAIRGRLPDLTGKTVVVGDTDPTGQDNHATPLGTRPGPEIQAAAIDTLLRGAPLRELRSGWSYGLIVFLGALVPLAALGLRQLRFLPLLAVELAAWPVATQLFFNGGRIAPFVPGLVAAVAGGLGTLVVAYATDVGERRRLRTQFARFAPPSVIDALADRGTLPGTELQATVLFADLRGFTSAAETLGAERVIALLNVYLAAMSDAILDHGGTVVSFMGDGIMAVFGAPLEQPDHADRALAAAQEMLGPRLSAFNAGLDAPFAMGVGLATGPVMSGTVGSARRLEYATVGDTTNTAARLEALTKETGHVLHVADTTRAALTRPHALVDAGEVTLRGRTVPTRLWTLEVHH